MRGFNIGEFLFRVIGYNVYGVIPGALLLLIFPPAGTIAFPIFQCFVLKDAAEQAMLSAGISNSDCDDDYVEYEYGPRGGRYTYGRSRDGGEYKRYR